MVGAEVVGVVDGILEGGVDGKEVDAVDGTGVVGTLVGREVGA